MSKTWYENGADIIRIYGAISAQLIIIKAMADPEPDGKVNPFSDKLVTDMESAHGKLNEAIGLLTPHLSGEALNAIAKAVGEFKRAWEGQS